MRYREEFDKPSCKAQLFIFRIENKRFTEFEFTTGNDLGTNKVPISVLFCIIEKNDLY